MDSNDRVRPRVSGKSVGFIAATTRRNCSKVISNWRKPPWQKTKA